MNSKITSLDLNEIAFSRARSRFMVFEEKEEGREGLYISLSYDAPDKIREHGLVKLEPYLDGEAVPYEYTANPGSLVMKTAQGSVEVVIEEPQILRIRAKGVGLKLFAHTIMHEGAVDRLNGTYEVMFASIGKLLYVPLKGEMSFSAPWVLNDMRPDDAVAICTPDENGVVEVAIHEYVANGMPSESYPDFDGLAEQSMADFKDWLKKYGDFSPENKELAAVAAYTVWICRQIPHKGNPHNVLKGEVIYNSRAGHCRAYAMDQYLQSMAITKDVETAFYYLTHIFSYMLENGQMPNWINDVYACYDMCRAPMVGAVAEIFIKNYGLEAVPDERWHRVFRDMVFAASWWMNFRVSGEIKLHYHHREECGFRGATLFDGGCPVCTADLMSFIVVMTDVLGHIANHLNIDESEVWWEYAENVIDSMLCDLWHNTGYVARAAGGIVESGNILNFVPLILGGRLPQDAQQCLIDTLKNDPLRSCEDGLLFEKGRPGIKLNAEQIVILGMLINGEGKEELNKALASLRREGIYDSLPREKTPAGAAWTSSAAASVLILLRADEDVKNGKEA